MAWSGVGVTKAPFVDFPVSKIFDLTKVPVRLFVSHSYLTGVTTATPVKYEHDIQSKTSVLTMVKNREINGTEEIGLVTPTPAQIVCFFLYQPIIKT